MVDIKKVIEKLILTCSYKLKNYRSPLCTKKLNQQTKIKLQIIIAFIKEQLNIKTIKFLLILSGLSFNVAALMQKCTPAHYDIMVGRGQRLNSRLYVTFLGLDFLFSINEYCLNMSDVQSSKAFQFHDHKRINSDVFRHHSDVALQICG